MKRSFIIVMAAVALVATACSSNPDTGQQPGGIDRSIGGEGVFALGASVAPFDSCDDFLTYVKQHAVERVGPYGLDGYGNIYPVAFAAEESVRLDAAFDSVADSLSSEGSGEFSTTNVQVAGIDEPDLVKTDGDRIFVVANGELIWIDATGDEPKTVATLALTGWGQQLFLVDDTILVMTSGNGGAQPFAAEGDAIYHSPTAVLQEITVSDPDDMAVVRTLTLDGGVLSARLTGETARIVLRSGPVGFNWVYPEGSGIKAEREATEANQQLIEDSTIENWVPWFVLEDHEARTVSDGPLLSCGSVGHPDEYSGLSMLSILTIDVAEGLAPGSSIGLLAEGETVYASHESLYVATSPWRWWPVARGEDSAPDTISTQIHRFDITDPTTATYAASGEVEGSLHSQFSLDEYEGVLRVVVTEDNMWWRSSGVPETSVVTLETLGTRLVQIGSVGGLGKNERVYSVRFIQDKAYVVTFRQVDPLYVVDLSDPRDPTVEGELKINGYSAYLHPIGEDLLLGVGQDATDEGRTTGTQVSVFDVSDPTNPVRTSKVTFKDAHSEAEWNHHAFLWWARDEIAVLPLQRWSSDERSGTQNHFAGAAILHATETRVQTVGEIEHPQWIEGECEDCGGWTEPVMRSLVIGRTLYTVSMAGLMSTDLDTLNPVDWLEF
ncbi:MAG: beta-propeller domain-containing protein [Acidimicrobiia bacterium]